MEWLPDERSAVEGVRRLSRMRCRGRDRLTLCHPERSRGICSSADHSWKCFSALFPSQLFDKALVLRIGTHKIAARGQLEICKVKAGRDGATYQGERCSIFQARGEPTAGPHYTLKNSIVSQMQFGVASIRLDHMNNQRTPRIKVPQLVGSDAMERGKISPMQQEVNRSRRGPVSPLGGNR